MELDDLKSEWEKAGGQLQDETGLSPSIIDAITRRKYHSKLKKITYPEIVGIIICAAASGFIIVYFGKLDSLFFKVTGILAIAVLLLLSVISFISIGRLSLPHNPGNAYAKTLKRFAIQRIRFHKLQRVNSTLSFLLMVLTVILLPKLFAGKNIAAASPFWLFAFCMGYILLVFFSRRVTRYYGHTLKQAEELLTELRS